MNELGHYRPAFLMMQLSFPFPSSATPLFSLSEGELSIFVHEYVHFLQDISSYCLLNNAYFYTEYVHAAADHIRKMSGRYFEIPLRLPFNKGNVDANDLLNGECMGDSEEMEDLFLLKIESEQDPFLIEGLGIDHIEKRILVTQKKRVHFGYMAVMESMAYIIESRISHPQSTPCDFPYMSAQMVVDKIYPEFGKEILNILALCDTSLQFSNSGNVFVSMLEQMKDRKWLPSKPEDVYDYVYSQWVCVMGEDMPFFQAIIKMSFFVEQRVNEYLKIKYNSHKFHDFVKNMLRFGLCMRLARPYFMIELANGDYADKNLVLREIIGYVGMPIIKDSKNLFYTISPLRKDYLSVLDIFPAINQVIRCLRNGSRDCEMMDFCKESRRRFEAGESNEPAPIVDKRCQDAPWKRCDDKDGVCSHNKIWVHWGLYPKQPK